mmetsp:Transcript_116787/g.376928  ORF Transcript_116787/g.376928 Transcript_116787/m.376928 type:complete len:283 (-) Transcript_116787:92-940(-)
MSGTSICVQAIMDSSISGYSNIWKEGRITAMQMTRKATRTESTSESLFEMTLAIFTLCSGSSSELRKRRIFTTLLRRPALAPSRAARAARTMTKALSLCVFSVYLSGSEASGPSAKEMSKLMEKVPMRSMSQKKLRGYASSAAMRPAISTAKSTNAVTRTPSSSLFVGTCRSTKRSGKKRATKSATSVTAEKQRLRRQFRNRATLGVSYQLLRRRLLTLPASMYVRPLAASCSAWCEKCTKEPEALKLLSRESFTALCTAISCAVGPGRLSRRGGRSPACTP